jgi:hypothetical protein
VCGCAYGCGCACACACGCGVQYLVIFDKITSKFQLKLKDRAAAANILGEALKDVIKKNRKEKIA